MMRQADQRRPDAAAWALVLLVIQNSVLVAVMHHSRTSPTEGQPRYLASTAVLLVELIKLCSSIVLAFLDTRKAHPSSSTLEGMALLRRSIFGRDCWRLVFPAVMYTLQNSLAYTAISNLDTVTFQVTYQLKILTTVLFSILLLGTHISPRQWIALALLTFGVGLVQVAGFLGSESWKDHLSPLVYGDIASLAASSALKGLLAVLLAVFISGLTCVYFEKLVKDSLPFVSLWTRNVQLSFFSIFPALFIGVLWQDGEYIRKHGFLCGYNPVVWLTIALQAFGGLIIAVCITYAGNVAKNFAASFSIVLSYAITSVLFGVPLTIPATGGAAVVLGATYLYHSGGATSEHALLPTNEIKQTKQIPLPKRLLYPR